jgi:hypothetical protein
MAQVARSLASLRISGDELMPSEITEALGCEPTESHIKGENIVGKNTGNVRITKSGMWRLNASERIPENLDAQIIEILSKLSRDLEVWKEIGSRFSIDLFVGLFMDESNEGLDMSPSSLKELGDRGILLGLDIYGPY